MNISITDLLEAGVHFGHQTRRWDPKMKPYIYKEQSGIYIIDLRKTLDSLDEAYKALVRLAGEGKTVLFVGTKRQAKESVKEDAARCEMYYVNERWLGGTLTNFNTIMVSMSRLEDLEAMEKDGRIEQLSKKERLSVDKQRKKLLKVLAGIRGMKKLPSCLIIMDTKKETIAVREARKLGIPLIGLSDTNSDPDDLDYSIPANDDAIRSIKLFTRVLSEAVIEGRSQYMKNKDFLEKQDKKQEKKPENTKEAESGKTENPKKTSSDESSSEKPKKTQEGGEAGKS